MADQAGMRKKALQQMSKSSMGDWQRDTTSPEDKEKVKADVMKKAEEFFMGSVVPEDTVTGDPMDVAAAATVLTGLSGWKKGIGKEVSRYKGGLDKIIKSPIGNKRKEELIDKLKTQGFKNPKGKQPKKIGDYNTSPDFLGTTIGRMMPPKGKYWYEDIRSLLLNPGKATKNEKVFYNIVDDIGERTKRHEIGHAKDIARKPGIDKEEAFTKAFKVAEDANPHATLTGLKFMEKNGYDVNYLMEEAPNIFRTELMRSLEELAGRKRSTLNKYIKQSVPSDRSLPLKTISKDIKGFVNTFNKEMKKIRRDSAPAYGQAMKESGGGPKYNPGVPGIPTWDLEEGAKAGAKLGLGAAAVGGALMPDEISEGNNPRKESMLEALKRIYASGKKRLKEFENFPIPKGR